MKHKDPFANKESNKQQIPKQSEFAREGGRNKGLRMTKIKNIWFQGDAWGGKSI